MTYALAAVCALAGYIIIRSAMEDVSVGAYLSDLLNVRPGRTPDMRGNPREPPVPPQRAPQREPIERSQH
jgi:hypothetical protein